MDNEVLKFGVRISNNIVYVNEMEGNGNDNYDIILIDEVTRNYNGNISYRVKLPDNYNSHFLEGGWEFRSLLFPGNWRGQNARFELQDKFGCIFTSDDILSELWYRNQPIHFVRETLQSALRFSQKNFSVKYFNVVKGLSLSSLIQERIGYYEFSEIIEQYIDDYQDVLLTLIKEDASMSFIDKLNLSFREKVKTIFLSNSFNNLRTNKEH